MYLAQHPRLPRRDALKLLPHGWSADDEYWARFNREADLASTLWHPHIVGLHDRGGEDGQLTTGDGSETKRTPDHVCGGRWPITYVPDPVAEEGPVKGKSTEGSDDEDGEQRPYRCSH